MHLAAKKAQHHLSPFSRSRLGSAIRGEASNTAIGTNLRSETIGLNPFNAKNCVCLMQFPSKSSLEKRQKRIKAAALETIRKELVI